MPVLPLREVREHALAPADRAAWPATLPPVRQLLEEGLELGPVTVVTGEIGSGKSTIIEAIARAFGLNAEGGTTNVRLENRADDTGLADHLQLVRGAGGSRRGFFLRAETMHALFTYYEEIQVGGALHELSHGEGFLEVVAERSRVRGLWLLDEPESALSLPGCLALLGQLRELVAGGSQVLLSTHSPVLAAMPGARRLELGDWGIREAAYDDLDLVRQWRGFLDAPERYLRHLG